MALLASRDLDPAGFTPAQRRCWDDLLAAGDPRPPVEPGAAERWRSWLEQHLQPAVALAPDDAAPLWISKTKLAALECDGRFLELQATPFAWTLRTALGTVAHRAIEIDLAGRRRRAVVDVVDQALADLASSTAAADAFLGGLNGTQTDDLRARSVDRVLELREVFPLLPAEWVRTEVACTARLAGGRLVLSGRPDVIVGRGHPARRQQILIDLKTGNRHPRHARDMRFYALLALLKYGAAPFRVATFYLDEADWQAEEVTDELLEHTARWLVDKTVAAAALTHAQPSEQELRLVPGPACGWCTRAPSCPAALRQIPPRQIPPRQVPPRPAALRSAPPARPLPAAPAA